MSPIEFLQEQLSLIFTFLLPDIFKTVKLYVENINRQLITQKISNATAQPFFKAISPLPVDTNQKVQPTQYTHEELLGLSKDFKSVHGKSQNAFLVEVKGNSFRVLTAKITGVLNKTMLNRLRNVTTKVKRILSLIMVATKKTIGDSAQLRPLIRRFIDTEIQSKLNGIQKQQERFKSVLKLVSELSNKTGIPKRGKKIRHRRYAGERQSRTFLREKILRFARGPFFALHGGIWCKLKGFPTIVGGENWRAKLMQKVMLGFFRDMDELWEKVADALKIAMPDVYVYYNDLQNLLQSHLKDFTPGIFMSVAINFESTRFPVFTTPHRDFDSKYGVCCVIPFGDYEGGALNILEHGFKFELHPGDIIFFPSQNIHFNNPLSGKKMRGSITIFVDVGFDSWAAKHGICFPKKTIVEP
ncbi:hypothetical protein HK098_004980 [Nowakowskiella sp. JEL0407]|nr:hypothetical protein HK098_004980 [Nowakowskiella sp. JEL0407]